ncbi:MAG TPA: hypothetical protein PKD53_08435 [Chloroflexaceae bacterium]|nr:hypothetical protein [Chloroflexaceae bacterium]
MGRRDEPELTPSEAELAEAEAATRRLLAAYGEPAPAEPPPGLAARVVASLPATPPAQGVSRPRWAPARPLVAWAAAAALLIVLGAVGALASLPGLVRVAGGPQSALGRISNALAATPLGPDGAAALALVALVAGAAIWWALASRRR